MSGLKSIPAWLDDRIGYTTTFKPLIEHPVPQTGWDYTIGSAALIAFTVQVVTGVALAFTYVPTPNDAYQSLQFITNDAILGNIVRGVHFWGASAMVLLVSAHAAQVFLIGSFKFPREVNWLSGTVLLVFTFGMAFTGQLLRWNQDAYWAIVVGASQAARAPIIGQFLVGVLFAGPEIGGATLTRFYATHVFMIPAIIFGLLGLHLYLVIRHGVSEPPVPGVVVNRRTYRERYEALVHKFGVPFWPDAGWKDVVFALLVGTVVLGLSIVLGPPALGAKADPTVLQADPRPDWYFLWYFALLALIPPVIENVFIIGFPLALGLMFLLLPFVAPQGERSPRRRPWAVGFVAVVVVSIAALVNIGSRAPWSPVLGDVTLPVSATQGLDPTQQAGAQVFNQHGCINCHAVAGVGGERGPNLSTIATQLSSDQLTWRILNGGRNMPAYGDTMSPQELSQLLAFLQTLK
ncbi:MAG: cytochrome b N-terminal domain-containing protein [Chloroflexi bacterium]|nr:cytochrome b N-terminal domain-containing protein [Chloroflexota bacterium]